MKSDEIHRVFENNKFMCPLNTMGSYGAYECKATVLLCTFEDCPIIYWLNFEDRR